MTTSVSSRTQGTSRAVAALAVLVAVAALGSWVAIRHVTTWSLMTDEIFWSKLATSLGEGQFPPVVRADDSSTSLLYPLVLMPLYRVLDTPSAFHAAHAINAALMASTAIPAFLLCRRLVVSSALALLAAAITVAVPWVALSTMLVTETIAYPAFMWALLAMHRALVCPGARTYAWTALALAAAYLARTQFIVLAPVFVVAAAGTCFAVPTAEWGSALRRHRTLWLACAGVAAIGLALVAGGHAGTLLGNYRFAVGGLSATPAEYLGTAATLVVSVGLGVGVLPLVAASAWAPAAIRRGDTSDRMAFAVLGSVVTAALVVFATVYITTYSGGDRYVFYIAPVLVLAATAALEDRRDLTVRFVGSGIAIAVLALVVSLPDQIFHASPVATLYPVLEDWSKKALSPFALAPGRNIMVAGGAGLAAAGLVVAARVGPRAAAPALGAVLVFCVVATGHALDRGVDNQVGGVPTTDGRAGWGDWIDRSVRSGASVGLVISPIGNPYMSGRTWWDAEFWNASVDRVFVAEGEDDYATIRERVITVDPETGQSVRPWADHLVFASSDLLFRPVGRRLATTTAAAEFPNSRLELWETTQPARAAWTTTGIRRDGWIALGASARIRAFSRGSRSQAQLVQVDLTLPIEFQGVRSYELAPAGEPPRNGAIKSFAPASVERTVVCVPAGGSADVLITPTGAPAADPALGVRVGGIAVEPTATCTP